MNFGACYPLHLGVTEAGDGEDGRIKTADWHWHFARRWIGDTIRVSLTEDPEFEIPVCRDLVKRYGSPRSDSQTVRRTFLILINCPTIRSIINEEKHFEVGNIGEQTCARCNR